jgi:hypothetical protein
VKAIRRNKEPMRVLLATVMAFACLQGATAQTAPRPSAARVTVSAGNIFIEKGGQRRRKHPLNTAGVRIRRPWLKRPPAGLPGSSSKAAVR